MGAAAEPVGEPLSVLEHPVQVGHGGRSLAERPGQLGQHQSPEVAGQAGISRHRAIELGDGLVHPRRAPQQRDLAGAARLEEPFEREEQRLVGPGSGPLLEVGVGLLVAVAGDEPSPTSVTTVWISAPGQRTAS